MAAVSFRTPRNELFTIGGGELCIIAGPCVIESRDHLLRHAEQVVEICRRVQVPVIFKSSFDKANRTSSGGYRGLGQEAGLAVLQEVRAQFGVPVITDVHLPDQVRIVAEVVDVLQIPAFLCRQTDLLVAAGETGKPVMVKKGQFLAPQDMKFVAEKIVSTGNKNVLLCERGTCFGYRELVVDFRSFAVMRELGFPVVFDATHSVQVMGGSGGSSSGNREYVPLLARAAVSAGVDAVFLEVHEQPDKAPSDGPNMLPITQLEALLKNLKQIHAIAVSSGAVAPVCKATSD